MREDSDKFELPITQTLFHKIGGGNEFFASLDFANGYCQLVIKAEDRYKTAFTFNNINYCFKRLPFGLKNSGDVFCRCIATILR